ncbi:hypothetical protein OPV22_030153 [Ensete ventricosum]|uniref:pectinesterase n=1 Tax=Ensete ventricosum TaxID=4639 RepID=A0AAV8QDD5_ENSVE|nr:hypothetical protein OPV22_030153 [Ensete ventricosum]
MRWLVLFLSVFSSISLRNSCGDCSCLHFENHRRRPQGRWRFQEHSAGDNNKWTKIHVAAGVYTEKVNVKSTKSYIVLEGDGAAMPSIEWGDCNGDSSGHDTETTATFTGVVTFAESGCTGMGSDLSGRVKLEKQLSDDELKKFIDILYIYGEGWLDTQPPLD